MKTILKRNHGFTLIELMIVVVIIGILAAIAIPNFIRYQLKSRSGEAPLNVKAVFTTQTAFSNKYGRLALGGPSAAAAGSVGYAWDPAAAANLGFTAMGYKPQGTVRFCYSSYAGTVRPVAAGVCGAAGTQTVFDIATGLPTVASTVLAVNDSTTNEVMFAASADLDNNGAVQSISQSDENSQTVEFVSATGEASGEALF